MSQNHSKPREEWDEDEQHDGRPKTDEIEVLVFVPGELPVLSTIPNTLSAMQAVVGSYIDCFTTGIEGTIGVCNDEGILLGLPPCRFIPKTGALIFGAFFVAGNGVNMHSLRPSERAEVERVLGPLLTSSQVLKAILIDRARRREIDALNAQWEKGE